MAPTLQSIVEEVTMKRIRGVQAEPCRKSVCSWHTRIIALMSIVMLCGTGAFAEVQDTDDIPELPSIEVRGIWLAHGLSVPVAVKVVKPPIPTRMVGTDVRMHFRINKDGKPIMIHSHNSPSDEDKRNLASIMKTYLLSWEFTPLYNKEGQPVEVKVALPVWIVEEGNGNADHYARVAVTEPILLAVLDR